MFLRTHQPSPSRMPTSMSKINLMLPISSAWVSQSPTRNISTKPYTDRQWTQHICSDSMSFLSHVSVSCVYQDLTDGSLHDSNKTTHAKTAVLSRIAGRLEATDATILSILHLLLSEAGGGDDSAFQVHAHGLRGLLHKREGVSQLPPQLATYATL